MKLWCPRARLPGGWHASVSLTIADGLITSIRTEAEPEGHEVLAGPVVAGMPNAHSHAFQYAMAGLAEHAVRPDDSFWTWRSVMYRFALSLSPEDVEAIAAMLYVDLLESGYTSVAEFHYIHHAPDGRPYDNPAELGERIGAAASTTGMGLTLLPVLYAHSGVGGQAPLPEQRRFLHTPESLQQTRQRCQAAGIHTGLALHSLRAVTPEQIDASLSHVDPTTPVHLHISEQPAEVEAVETVLGTTPIAWLLDHCAVDDRWSLVHATHATAAELSALQPTGATVVICPTTEANLGDGIFAATRWWQQGSTAIGTDSHVVTDLAAEVRCLETVQRLAMGRRNLLRGTHLPAHVGADLHSRLLDGGARSLGRRTGLRVGAPADLVVLHTQHRLYDRQDDLLLDTWLLTGDRRCVRDVWSRGVPVVSNHVHCKRAAVEERYRKALRGLHDRA